jgi:hypothetical protein
MNRQRLSRMSMAAAFAVLLVALPLGVFAGHAATKKTGCTTRKTSTKHVLVSNGTAIAFGSVGGNMQPWTVTFNADGTVTAKGWVKPRNNKLMNPASTLQGFETLAQGIGFYSMPGLTNCTGTLPDISSRYVTMTTTTGSRTVRFHGGCGGEFNQLWSALANAADYQH